MTGLASAGQPLSKVSALNNGMTHPQGFGDTYRRIHADGG